MHRTRTFVLTSLLLATAPALAQSSLLPYLPENTIMAVSAPDLAASLQRFQQMPLAKMWVEQEVQDFVADLKSLLSKKFDELMEEAKEQRAKGELPFDPALLQHLRLENMTFALTQLELGGPGAGMMFLPKIGWLAHLQVGAVAPELHGLLQLGLGLLEQQSGGKMIRSDSKVGDVAVISLQAPEEAGIEIGLTVAMVPGGFLIGTLADEVKQVVGNLQQNKRSLGDSARYQALANKLPQDKVELETFIRFDPMVDFVLELLGMASEMVPQLDVVDMEGVTRALAAMGLRNLGISASTTSYKGGQSITHEFRTGTAPAAELDMSFLKWVPKDAASFGAGTMDVASYYDMLLKGMEAYNPEFAKQMLQQLAEVEQQLGFKLRDDFFGSFGDRYIYWSMAVSGMQSAPEAAMLVKIKDEKKMLRVIENLARMTDGAISLESSERRGLKSYQLQFNGDLPAGLPFNPLEIFQPTFAFKGEYMVVAFSPSDVKRAMQRMDREDEPKGDIRSNKEYQTVAGQLPASISSMSFGDWKMQFESFYNLVVGALAFVRMSPDVPIDSALLPESNTLTKHLFPALTYTTHQSDGTLTVSISPFGPETMLLLAAAVGAGVGVFMPAVTRGF